MPSEETAERIVRVVNFGRTVLHWTWIPFVIYIGYTNTKNPSLIKLISPLA